MRTSTHVLLAVLAIAAAAVSAVPARGSGPAKAARDAVANEKAAARATKGIVRQAKKSLKAAQKDAQGTLAGLVKAARSEKGLAALGIFAEPGSLPVRLNRTEGERFFSLGLDALGTFQRDGLEILDSAADDIAKHPAVAALYAQPGAGASWSEGGALRGATLALRDAYETYGTKLDRTLGKFVQANAGTGNPVTLRRYPMPPCRGVSGAGGVLGGTGALYVGTHAGGRVFGLFAQPEDPPTNNDAIGRTVRLYSIDGTLYSEAAAVTVPGTRTIVYRYVDFGLRDVPDGAGRLQMEEDDGAGGNAIPRFWDHVVIPGDDDGGGGDDPDDEPPGCFFPAQQLAFANVANVRTDYVHPVEASVTVRGTELLALTLRFGDDPDTPVGTLRFSLVEGQSGVTLDPDEVDGEHVRARITPATGVLPDVMLDPTGGVATDAWFLDPGDEYEILICFSVDPRVQPSGPYSTKIRIVGRGRAGLLHAPPYRSFSFDFAYDGLVDRVER